MRVTPIAVTLLAGTALAKLTHKPCSSEPGAAYTPLWSTLSYTLVKPVSSSVPAVPEPPSVIAARALQGFTNLGTRFNKCMDVTGGILKGGTRLQIWECVSGSKYQATKFVSGNLRLAGGLCADVPGGQAYPGAEVQAYPCTSGNKNQLFEVVGTNVRFTGSNFCLDVKDGRYDSGRPIQLYPCYFDQDPNVGNQHWWTGGQPRTSVTTQQQAPYSVPTSASTNLFAGAPVVSIDAFCAINTACAPIKQAFLTAAAAKGVHETFLASIAMEESTCSPGVDAAGLMQFTSDATWNAHKGSAGASKTNAYDAAWAAADYLKDLLDAHNWDLNGALREYNGDINDGGNPNYGQDIRTWMAGGSPY